MFELNEKAWDCKFYDMKVGQVTLSQDGLSAESLKKAIITQDYQVVMARFGKDHLPQIHALESIGFSYLENLVTLAFDSDQKPSSCPEPVNSDLAEVIAEKAQGLFKTSYMFSLSSLPDDKIDEMHKHWVLFVHNEPEGVVLAVTDDSNQPLGFVTLRNLQDAVIIDLFGVFPEAQGQGVAGQLLEKAFAFSKSRWNKGICVKTQSDNFAALRVYTKAGYRIVQSDVTLGWEK